MSNGIKPYQTVSSHRPEPQELPDDPQEAVAFVLAAIHGKDNFDKAQAVESLNARVVKLANADSSEALMQLAAHLPVLEALYLRFAMEALEARMADHKSKLLRMSLAAQSAYARTVALIAGLKLQSQGKAYVNIENEIS